MRLDDISSFWFAPRHAILDGNHGERTNPRGAVRPKTASEEKGDIYLYNGPVNNVGYLSTPYRLLIIRRKAVLLITTYGGSAESGYRIARYFQRFYEEFWVYPTSVCASAGTLIAMGANGLYMAPFSELGPLDVQLAKRNELGEYKSGLVTKAALEKLRDEALWFWENFMLESKEKGAETSPSIHARTSQPPFVRRSLASYTRKSIQKSWARTTAT